MPNIVGAYAAVKQIDDYLADVPPEQTREAAEPLSEKRVFDVGRGDPSIVLTRSSMQPAVEGRPVLRKSHVEISQSSFTFIIGPSASGRTTLLEAILGETARSESLITSAFAAQDIAYAAQRPWIRSGPIKNNILASSQFDEPFYHEVLHACALDDDAGHLSYDTASGGTKLSGGQRQKVVST